MSSEHYPDDEESYQAGLFVGVVLGVLGTAAVCAVILAVLVWAL